MRDEEHTYIHTYIRMCRVKHKNVADYVGSTDHRHRTYIHTYIHT